MGIFNSLIQLRGGDYSKAMKPTNGAVYTPGNPGPLDDCRSIPIVPNTREFSPVEAERLKILAIQRAEISKASQESYQALESIDSSDTQIFESNRAYRGRIAANELKKKQSEARYLSGLNDLRQGYAEAGANLLESRKKSDRRLEIIESRTRQILKGVY